MTTKLLRQLILMGIAPMLIAVASPANAEKTTPPENTNANTSAIMTKDQIDDRYDATMKRCDTLKGDDKDLCEKQAKSERNAAEADAKAAKKKAEAEHDATEEKRDGAYDVAKEKCDAMSGDAKDECITQAKTKYGK